MTNPLKYLNKKLYLMILLPVDMFFIILSQLRPFFTRIEMVFKYFEKSKIFIWYILHVLIFICIFSILFQTYQQAAYNPSHDSLRGKPPLAQRWGLVVRSRSGLEYIAHYENHLNVIKVDRNDTLFEVWKSWQNQF